MYGSYAQPLSPPPTPQPPGLYPNQSLSPSDNTCTPTVYTINTMSSSEPSLTKASSLQGPTIEVSVSVDPAVPPETVETSRAGSATRPISEVPNVGNSSRATEIRATDALVPYLRPWTSLRLYTASEPPPPSRQPWSSPCPKPDNDSHVDVTSEWNQDVRTEEYIEHSDRFRFDSEVEAGSQRGSRSKSWAKSKPKPKAKERQRGKRKSKGKRKDKGKDKKIMPHNIAVEQPNADALSVGNAEPLDNAAHGGDAEVVEDVEASNDAGPDDRTAPEGGVRISDSAPQGGDSGWVDDAEPYFDTNTAWDAGTDAEADLGRGDKMEACSGSGDSKGSDIDGTGESADIDAGSISKEKEEVEKIEASEPPEPLLVEAGPTDPICRGSSRPGTDSSHSWSSKEEIWPQILPKHPTRELKNTSDTRDVQQGQGGEAPHVSEPEIEHEHGPNAESVVELEPTSRRPPKEKPKRRSQTKRKTGFKDKEKSKFKSNAATTPAKSKSKTKQRRSLLEIKISTSSRRKSGTGSITPSTSVPKPKPKASKNLSNPLSRSSTAANTPSKSKSKRRSTSLSANTGGSSSRHQSLVPSNVEKNSKKKEQGCWGCSMM